MINRIARILVGSLFMVSGLIKANDPMGFSYKLNDYFAPGVFNLPWLDQYALQLAVFVCVAEIVLGVAILFAARMRLASWSLLLMMIFFTFLTGYTAVANWFFDNPDHGATKFFEGVLGFVAREDISYMKDCGCFGDAIKLDPWESFWKDVVLMVLSVIIFVNRTTTIALKELKSDLLNLGISLGLIAAFSMGFVSWTFPIWFSITVFVALLLIKYMMHAAWKDWVMAGAATLLTFWFCMHCINHLPIKDFRPYRIGNNIAELKECPPGAPQDVYKDTWFYKVNGVVGEYTTEQAPWDMPGAEFVDRRSELISKGCEPSIHDFVIEAQDGTDMTEDILAEDAMLLIITYDVNQADEEPQAAINALYDAAMSDGGPYVYALAANSWSDIEAYKHKHQHMFDYLTADGTMLKTVIRSNPGIVLLRKGTVTAKWHANDVPEYSEVKALLN